MKTNSQITAWLITFSAGLMAGGLSSCSDSNEPDMQPPASGATPYITRVLDYVPAPGQFINTMPEYEEGVSSAPHPDQAVLLSTSHHRNL